MSRTPGRAGEWGPGRYLTHRYNPELGVGRVRAREGRTLVVEFPRSGTTLRLTVDADALVPIDISPGRTVRVVATREESAVAALEPDGRVRLDDGRVLQAHELWPLEMEGALLSRLVLADLDDPEDLLTRLDILHLKALREADGLGSFLGGRVRLFPHQLYVAERATQTDPVRWLLADEVGLGKTIEAALVLNHLVHTRRASRCLVVAPESLTVQWLGELWRKYHQVFTLLDDARLADVARDFGEGFNPFDVHRRAVVALERLVERPQLTAQAVEAGIDLLVVDEAQRLRRPPGHPGEPAWRAVAPIAALGRHVLLLSATPLEDDAHGFFRLLQLLRPADFPEDVDVEARLASGVPLPPCTSSTRRADIGGLPPRLPIPIVLEDRDAWAPRAALEQTLRSAPAPHAVARRTALDRIRRALSSGAALTAVLGPEARDLRQQAEAIDRSDPRLVWLASQAPRWRDAGEKTLLFVAQRETLELVRTALSQRAQLATAVFHEGLPTARRDLEVARFREPQGPSLLVSTECGGEGRNFEFCRRLVLFDLPWKPSVIEQRIGRLDRIGRRVPVEIVYFVPPGGLGRDVARLFDALGLFREPMAGVEPQLARVEGTIETLALDPAGSFSDERIAALVAEAHEARSRVREAAYRELHRDRYRSELGPGILARVPDALDATNERVVVTACSRLGLHVDALTRRRTYAVELGNEALVDALPGVPGGTSYRGTFDRERAVEDETLDYFASGHPLVEGVFAHFDDHAVGRVARLDVAIGSGPGGEGLLAVYADAGAVEAVVFDATGRARPDWAAAFTRRPPRVRRADDEHDPRAPWRAIVQQLGARLDPSRRPHLVASIRVRPQR